MEIKSTYYAKRSLFGLAFFLLAGCASNQPPSQPNDICAIFKEHSSWHASAKEAQNKWGVPLSIPLAIMYQESSFQYAAAPPMRYFLGFIPIGRASDAFGYAQVKAATWDDYKRETGNNRAKRTNFGDSTDFIGWYINKANKLNGVAKTDAKNLYLNYHEGYGGYRNGSYKNKQWLINTADKVAQRSQKYAAQYQQCQSKLNSSWF